MTAPKVKRPRVVWLVVKDEPGGYLFGGDWFDTKAQAHRAARSHQEDVRVVRAEVKS